MLRRRCIGGSARRAGQRASHPGRVRNSIHAGWRWPHLCRGPRRYWTHRRRCARRKWTHRLAQSVRGLLRVVHRWLSCVHAPTRCRRTTVLWYPWCWTWMVRARALGRGGMTLCGWCHSPIRHCGICKVVDRRSRSRVKAVCRGLWPPRRHSRLYRTSSWLTSSCRSTWILRSDSVGWSRRHSGRRSLGRRRCSRSSHRRWGRANTGTCRRRIRPHSAL